MSQVVTAPRVVIYTRVSSANQEENSSLDTQLGRCRQFADDHGWQVVATYREVHSGAELFERPQLARLREALRAHSADIVLAYALDRISRSQAHLGFLISEWDHLGISLQLVTEQLADTPEGRLLQSVRGFVAEMERMKIRERTQRGIQARIESGKPLPGQKALRLYVARYPALRLCDQPG
ncbi:MAG: recombinase family protein [Thermomicrobiales bacterium]